MIRASITFIKRKGWKMTQTIESEGADQLGFVHVYTGTGKGKTTAALGLGLRALGKGLKIYMIQFMKGDIEYGEISAVRNLDGFSIEQFGRPDFVDRDNPAKVDIELAQKGLERAKEILAGMKYDLVILDEINVAIDWKLVELDDVVEIIKNKPKNVELILTGRYAHPKIIELADLVTDMQEVKHPYQTGVLARDGIEH
jgi:cob(I)alamin adenosyltransferase